MVYGQSLAHEGGLNYNTNQGATGATSPLWAFCAALAHLLTGNSAPSREAACWLQLIGALFHAVGAMLVADLAWLGTRRKARAMALLAAGLLAGSSPILAFAGVSGMEVPLASALLAGTLVALARGRPLLASLLAGLGAVARPESILAIPVVLGLLALRRAGARTLVGGALLAAAPAAAWAARNLSVSGRPLPATFYMKATSPRAELLTRLRRPILEVLGQVEPTASIAMWVGLFLALGFGVAGLVALLRRGGRLRRSTWGLAAAVIALGYLLGVSLMMNVKVPQSFYFQRYFLPPLGLFCAAGVVGLLEGWARAQARLWRRAAPRWAPIVPAVALLGLVTAQALADAIPVRDSFAEQASAIEGAQVAMGQHLVKATAPTAVVWTQDAGAIRYFGQRRTVDILRLNTPDVFVYHSPLVLPGWEPNYMVLAPLLWVMESRQGLLQPMFTTANAPGAWDEIQQQLSTQTLFACNPDGTETGDRILLRIRDGKYTPVAAGVCRAPPQLLGG